MVCLTLTHVPGDALAQSQVTLTPSTDNSIYEEDGSRSNGEGDFLFVGLTGTNNGMNARRALIAFDVADELPDDAQVESVELTLHVSAAPPTGPASTDVDLHRVSRDWGEGTSDAGTSGGTGAPAESGDATWTHALYDDVTWTTDGGDFEGTPSGTITLGGTGSTQSVESSNTLAADVQSWLDDPASNFGWILVGDEATAHTARRLFGRSHDTEANRPQLTIVYSTTTAAENPDLPGSFVLEGNHPNPFHRSTVVRYELDRTREVSLEIYDVNGRPVRTAAPRVQSAGPHEMEVGGSDLASGVYLYCLSTSSSRACRTFTVLR